MNTKQQTDDAKISVFRDGRFTKEMMIAGIDAVGRAMKNTECISAGDRQTMILSVGFSAMLKAYDVEQEDAE